MSTAGPSLVDVLVEQLEDLPASRAAALLVVRTIEDEGAGAAQVAAAVAGDAALTARLIRLANSVYYGLSGRVRTPVFAVTVVGFDTVRSLAAVSAAGFADPGSLPPGFWERSAQVAAGGMLVARRVGAPAPEAFCVGLLHDLGSALLRQHDPERHDLVLEVAAGREELLLHREALEYGGTHADLGAQVLASWHLPPDLCAAIAAHHAEPARSSPPVLRALQAGLALSDLVQGGLPEQAAPALAAADVPPDEVAVLLQQVREAGSALAAAFGS